MLDPTLALLDVGQMGEADRLTVAAGIPATQLMENAGGSVAREIIGRWSLRPIAILCSSRKAWSRFSPQPRIMTTRPLRIGMQEGGEKARRTA